MMTNKEERILSRYQFWKDSRNLPKNQILATDCDSCGCGGGCSCSIGCGGSCSKGCGCSSELILKTSG